MLIWGIKFDPKKMFYSLVDLMFDDLRDLGMTLGYYSFRFIFFIVSSRW